MPLRLQSKYLSMLELTQTQMVPQPIWLEPILERFTDPSSFDHIVHNHLQAQFIFEWLTDDRIHRLRHCFSLNINEHRSDKPSIPGQHLSCRIRIDTNSSWKLSINSFTSLSLYKWFCQGGHPWTTSQAVRQIPAPDTYLLQHFASYEPVST